MNKKIDTISNDAAQELLKNLKRLTLEAIHYRNTHIGEKFLNESIALSEVAINKAEDRE